MRTSRILPFLALPLSSVARTMEPAKQAVIHPMPNCDMRPITQAGRQDFRAKMRARDAADTFIVNGHPEDEKLAKKLITDWVFTGQKHAALIAAYPAACPREPLKQHFTNVDYLNRDAAMGHVREWMLAPLPSNERAARMKRLSTLQGHQLQEFLHADSSTRQHNQAPKEEL